METPRKISKRIFLKICLCNSAEPDTQQIDFEQKQLLQLFTAKVSVHFGHCLLDPKASKFSKFPYMYVHTSNLAQL